MAAPEEGLPWSTPTSSSRPKSARPPRSPRRSREIDGVTKAEDVTGPYDVIVRAEAATHRRARPAGRRPRAVRRRHHPHADLPRRQHLRAGTPEPTSSRPPDPLRRIAADRGGRPGAGGRRRRRPGAGSWAAADDGGGTAADVSGGASSTGARTCPVLPVDVPPVTPEADAACPALMSTLPLELVGRGVPAGESPTRPTPTPGATRRSCWSAASTARPATSSAPRRSRSTASSGTSTPATPTRPCGRRSTGRCYVQISLPAIGRQRPGHRALTATDRRRPCPTGIPSRPCSAHAGGSTVQLRRDDGRGPPPRRRRADVGDGGHRDAERAVPAPGRTPRDRAAPAGAGRVVDGQHPAAARAGRGGFSRARRRRTARRRCARGRRRRRPHRRASPNWSTKTLVIGRCPAPRTAPSRTR